MFKKFDNKTLAIVFGALLLIVLAIRAYNSHESDRTFQTEIVEIDPEKVDAVYIYPKAEGGKEIKLTQQGEEWRAEMEGNNAPSDSSSILSVVRELAQIKPTRLASKKQDKWDKYEVTDSAGTRIKIMEGGETTLDIYVGKFSMKQSKQMNPYQQRGGVEGISYVRLADEDEVYATDGFLAMTVNQKFDTWRNRKLITVTSDNFTELSFTYPADSGFVLNNLMGNWMLGDGPADSTKVVGLLGKLNNLQHFEFADGFTPGEGPVYSLKISGNNMTEPIQIDGYAWNGDIAIRSSQNPETYFKGGYGQAGKLFEKIFPTKASLLKDPNELTITVSE